MTRPGFGEHGETGPTILSYAPAESVSFTFDLNEISDSSKEFNIGGLGRKLSVSLAPEENGSESTSFSFSDPSPSPGINPYWIRVVQTDMEMAWTSPIFIDYARR